MRAAWRCQGSLPGSCQFRASLRLRCLSCGSPRLRPGLTPFRICSAQCVLWQSTPQKLFAIGTKAACDQT